jgi:hypothetical protein
MLGIGYRRILAVFRAAAGSDRQSETFDLVYLVSERSLSPCSCPPVHDSPGPYFLVIGSIRLTCNYPANKAE